VAGLCGHNEEPSGSITFWEIPLAETLLASQEGLWCMKLDTNYTSMFLLRDGRSRDRISVEARFSAPSRPPRCRSVPNLSQRLSGWVLALTTHHHLVVSSRKSRAIPPLPLGPSRPVLVLTLRYP